MTLTRAATSLIAVLAVLGVLAPDPTRAAPTVYSSSLVCADITFDSCCAPGSTSACSSTCAGSSGVASISQRAGVNANANLKLAGDNLVVEFKAVGLPASSPALCAVLCVVDGMLDLFDFAAFDPCGGTN